MIVLELYGFIWKEATFIEENWFSGGNGMLEAAVAQEATTALI